MTNIVDSDGYVNTLELIFNTNIEDKYVTISVPYPKKDLTSSTIESAAEKLLCDGGIFSDKCTLTSFKSAQYRSISSHKLV